MKVNPENYALKNQKVTWSERDEVSPYVRQKLKELTGFGVLYGVRSQWAVGDLRPYWSNWGKTIPVNTGRAGMPDFWALLPGGRFLAIETKSTTGKLSDAQKKTRELILSLGGLYEVPRSPQEFDQLMKTLGVKEPVYDLPF